MSSEKDCETVPANSSQDSCSTILSHSGCCGTERLVSLQWSFQKDSHHGEDGCVVTSTEVTAPCVEHDKNNNCTLRLSLGRSHVKAALKTKQGTSEWLDHISRRHTDLLLHCDGTKSSLSSVDVVDHSTNSSSYLNGVHLTPGHRYHYNGEDARVGLGRHCTVWVGPPRHVEAKRGVSESPSFSSSSCSSSTSCVTCPSQEGATFVYTTGIQLTAREEEQCKALGVVVNPPLHLASSAFVLVVQKPLIRSVKLLTVLPHVRAVVSRSWLTRVLKERQVSVPLDEYPYTEPRSKKSIEAVNGFSLHATLQIPIHVRRRLFASFTFWVHGDARPQDPPLNDLKSVILSSGGSIATRLSEGKVFVLPNKAPSETVLRRMKSVLSAPDNIFVVPDDVFKCVLQQNGSLSTTVDISARSFTPCKTQGGKSQRSTPAKKRKTI